ncbi:hypothetical protein CB1_056579050 [Camelus ferus]|nr:hypothetical protein CB1_056579050 [Camelus ferus]
MEREGSRFAQSVHRAPFEIGSVQLLTREGTKYRLWLSPIKRQRGRPRGSTFVRLSVELLEPQSNALLLLLLLHYDPGLHMGLRVPLAGAPRSATAACQPRYFPPGPFAYLEIIIIDKAFMEKTGSQPTSPISISCLSSTTPSSQNLGEENQRLHLPPDLSDTVSRSSKQDLAESAKLLGPGCGMMAGGKKHLDF